MRLLQRRQGPAKALWIAEAGCFYKKDLLHAGCTSCRPSNSVNALNVVRQQLLVVCLSVPNRTSWTRFVHVCVRVLRADKAFAEDKCTVFLKFFFT